MAEKLLAYGHRCRDMPSGHVWGLQDLLGLPEEPTGNVTAKDDMGASGGADTAARNIVAAPRARASCRPVEGVGKLPAKVPLRTEGPELLEFTGAKPSHNCSDVGHDMSLRAGVAGNNRLDRRN